mgnify:CR=1 FL=1
MGMDRKVRAAWILIAILCFSTLSVSWLELSGSTEFTSGKPERSELIVEIEVDGSDIVGSSEKSLQNTRRKFGMLFQRKRDQI